ncbi:putative TIR domain, P-loop containing nucleoside triphosphate hydrolase [Helianthus annuus]|nr:putative TIR domain, P-loop containing nucleoside triphosphate hydrolase [Helianthus annuus]KAJ0924731.1 putative TIR domain, P-loop containing nucleoside triphosphate hydrolase [Helianthus annuus]
MEMVSPSHFLFMFICIFIIYKVLDYIYKVLQFIYKVLPFILQKISSPLKKNDQVPSLNQSTPASSSRPCKYDVFLSFRGEDTRKTFVDHLYSALVDRQIHTYKDDVTLPQGEEISPTLFKAIEESRIAVVVFSKNYALSSWCLEELAYIMKLRDERGFIVMPIFYDVNPSELRKQNGDTRKAFDNKEGKNTTRIETWRKALVDASMIAGWDPKNIANGHESKAIKVIVDTIINRLSPLNFEVDEHLVGMTTRLQDLKSRLEIGSPGVRMVGIWGVGGSGKTTLASSLYMESSCYFDGHHIVENIREESNKYGLKRLQENILSAFLKAKVEVHSIVEGKHMIKNMLRQRNVLIILDDVNDVDQLEALAGSHKWFGSGSRIIITTRDEHLLRTHKVDEVCPIRLLSHDEAIQLFNIHAFNEKDPIEDYDTLSLRVVSYAAGLPLALKVFGSFIYGRKKNEWISALDKLKDLPDLKVMDILKVSYDGLETYQKKLFLDIACFFRGERKSKAMKILEACDFHPEIGTEVLRQKSLITIVDGRFDMHDLIQEMGHYIVRGEHPNNPEKHSRVWKREEIINMCFGDATMENEIIEAIEFDGYSCDHDQSSRFCKIVSNMKKLRWLNVGMGVGEYEGPNFLSNELQYIKWHGYPASSFPKSFQPMKLVVLKLQGSMQTEVWEGCKHLPHLKVLQLRHMKKLLSTPDFHGLPCLQKLTLFCCYELEEIHPSLEKLTSLEYLKVSDCPKLRMFPTIVHMENLKKLGIEACCLEDGEIPSGIGCKKLLELPKLPSNLAILLADGCNSLTTVGDCHQNCKWLCQVSLRGGGIINDGGRLLQSMLEGKAVENGPMLLRLPGVEVAKAFTPHLLVGSRCRLQLPENWCNDFGGFLMCAIFTHKLYGSDCVWIRMNEATSDTNAQDDVVWEESVRDKYRSTWVWYISFGSLRHTTWWDQTHKALLLNIEKSRCTSFGIRLIGKKSRSGLTGISIDSSSDYTSKFKIEHDSKSSLTISLTAYAQGLY